MKFGSIYYYFSHNLIPTCEYSLTDEINHKRASLLVARIIRYDTIGEYQSFGVNHKLNL